jgi:hypothetical protein
MLWEEAQRGQGAEPKPKGHSMPWLLPRNRRISRANALESSLTPWRVFQCSRENDGAPP